MRKFFLPLLLLSSVFLITGCDALQTSADKIRPRSSGTAASSTNQPLVITSPSTSVYVPKSITSIDTSSWQRFEFKELGFSIQLPFATKDITLTYKDGRRDDTLPVSATNPLMYWYKGFLKGQSGDYTFVGGTSENYASGKEWQPTDASQLIKIGDNYQINNLRISPLAHVPAQNNLLIAFDMTKDYYHVIKSPLGAEQWYGAVFTIPNNKRFKVALLQFRSQDSSLDQLVAALKTVQFTAPQFPLVQVSTPTSTPKPGTPAPKPNPGNAPFAVNRSNNPVVCGSSPVGGKNTKWVFSCSDRRDSYSVGETVYGLFRIDNIFKNFRFKTEVHKDGAFQWEDVGEWNNVDEKWGWARSYAMPVLTNLSAGNWEARFFVDTGSGFSGTPLASTNFWVYGNTPAAPSVPPTPPAPSRPPQPFSYDNNGQVCGSQPSGGNSTKWWYTCSNPQTTFYRGQTAYGMIRIDKVYLKHTFMMEVYKDGTYQWSHSSTFNDVDEQNGWGYAFYLPVLSNLESGNWSVNIYLVPQNGNRQFLKTLTFRVNDQGGANPPSAAGCITTDNALLSHGENAQAGTKVCDFNNAPYTINNLIYGSGCYTSSVQSVTVAQDAVYIDGQQQLSYGSRSARVWVAGCYGNAAPSYSGDNAYRVYYPTQAFRIIAGTY